MGSQEISAHRGYYEAERFRKFRENSVDVADSTTDEMLSKMEFEEGESVLDFGCGGGTFLARYIFPIIEKYNLKVTGLDISENQIEVARKYNSHPAVEYVCGDILSKDSPLIGRKFDKIISIMVIQHTDYVSVIKELSNLLTKNGKLYVVATGEEKYFQYLDKIRNHSQLSKHLGFHVQPDWVVLGQSATVGYRNALTQAGLEEIELDTKTQKHNFLNMNEVTEFRVSVFPAVTSLTPELVDALKELSASFVSESWMSSPCQDVSKPISLDYKILSLLARKNA